MKHIYWAVRCKSPGCATMNVLNYIGVYEGQEHYPIPMSAPEDFDFGCMRCGNIHTYTQTDLVLQVTEQPPPEGWEGGF